MKKKEKRIIPENQERIKAENNGLKKQKEKATRSTKIPVNRENLLIADNLPSYEEKVVTEILFPLSGNLVIKKIIFPNSRLKDPIILVDNTDIEIDPSLLTFDHKKIAVSTIRNKGKEDRVLFEILITETGKIVMRGNNFLSLTYPEEMIEFYPRSEVIVKSDIILSSGKVTETKRILFLNECNF